MSKRKLDSIGQVQLGAQRAQRGTSGQKTVEATLTSLASALAGQAGQTSTAGASSVLPSNKRRRYPPQAYVTREDLRPNPPAAAAAAAAAGSLQSPYSFYSGQVTRLYGQPMPIAATRPQSGTYSFNSGQVTNLYEKSMNTPTAAAAATRYSFDSGQVTDVFSRPRPAAAASAAAAAGAGVDTINSNNTTLNINSDPIIATMMDKDIQKIIKTYAILLLRYETDELQVARYYQMDDFELDLLHTFLISAPLTPKSITTFLNGVVFVHAYMKYNIVDRQIRNLELLGQTDQSGQSGYPLSNDPLFLIANEIKNNTFGNDMPNELKAIMGQYVMGQFAKGQPSGPLGPSNPAGRLGQAGFFERTSVAGQQRKNNQISDSAIKYILYYIYFTSRMSSIFSVHDKLVKKILSENIISTLSGACSIYTTEGNNCYSLNYVPRYGKVIDCYNYCRWIRLWKNPIYLKADLEDSNNLAIKVDSVNIFTNENAAKNNSGLYGKSFQGTQINKIPVYFPYKKDTRYYINAVVSLPPPGPAASAAEAAEKILKETFNVDTAFIDDLQSTEFKVKNTAKNKMVLSFVFEPVDPRIYISDYFDSIIKAYSYQNKQDIKSYLNTIKP